MKRVIFEGKVKKMFVKNIKEKNESPTDSQLKFLVAMSRNINTPLR